MCLHGGLVSGLKSLMHKMIQMNQVALLEWTLQIGIRPWIGEYELRKFAPGEEKKQKATEAKAIYESSVICDVLETRTTEYHRSSVPVMNSIEMFNKNGMALSVDGLVSKKMFTIQNKFMLATL